MITISGRCRRTTSAISRRSGTPYSRIAVGLAAGTRPASTPTIRADSTCSASRTRRHSSGSIPSMPASPEVTMQ